MTLPQLRHTKSYGQLYTPVQPSPLRVHSATFMQTSSSSPSDRQGDVPITRSASPGSERLSRIQQRKRSFNTSNASLTRPLLHEQAQSAPQGTSDTTLSSESAVPSRKRPAAPSESSFASETRSDSRQHKRSRASGENHDVESEEEGDAMEIDVSSQNTNEVRPNRKRPPQSEAGDTAINGARRGTKMRKLQQRRISNGSTMLANQKGQKPREDGSSRRESPPSESTDEESTDRSQTISEFNEEDMERVKAARAKLAAKGKSKLRVSDVGTPSTLPVTRRQGTPQAKSSNLEVRDEDRKSGEEWEDARGQLYRKGDDGRIRRQIEVYEFQLKHKMVSHSPTLRAGLTFDQSQKTLSIQIAMRSIWCSQRNGLLTKRCTLHRRHSFSRVRKRREHNAIDRL